jgi:hypothetical protein
MKPEYWCRRNKKKLGELTAKLAIAIWSNEPLQDENKKTILEKWPRVVWSIRAKNTWQKRPAIDFIT